ncbi:DUF1211 domain-containing protein [Clavibacter michiganensis]|uniref:DUF1211 domain-containing protein n=1 Tax=Clavibacter michiganensis TaxID=28447 RepID=A0A2S5VWP7_9MICO|nr:TMEM175 family protein [Clavibacter michiganensis]PPF70461.1 DUF1211 domain-containing protein [Clavibacter michiganensis]
MSSERGLERLVAFSDAVVAIAITLVVLPLVDTARDVDGGSVADFVRENAAPLGAAALSFVVIAALWQAHHSVLGRIRALTRGMMRANWLWLAAIVFLPLPTVLIVGAAQEDRLGVVIYIATMLVASASLAVLAELGIRAGAALDDDPAAADTSGADGTGHDHDPDQVPPSHAALRRSRWIPTGLMALALVLAAAVPGVGTWALLVLLITIPLERLGRPRRRPRRTPPIR